MDDNILLVRAPKSGRVRAAAKTGCPARGMVASASTRSMQGTSPARQTRSTDSDSSDNDGYPPDDDSNNESNPDVNNLDTLDQDEDVILAAEEAQEEDLNEAAKLAELRITIVDGEQKTASTALLKVHVGVHLLARVFTDLS